jgi:hypothetical protein
MSTNRMRGWRRIGIVVSVVWFIAFAAYVWSDSNLHNGDFYSSQLRMCKAILDVADESLPDNLEERNNKLDENWAKYEKCQADAEKLFLSEADQLYKGIPILLGVDLATIAVGTA